MASLDAGWAVAGPRQHGVAALPVVTAQEGFIMNENSKGNEASNLPASSVDEEYAEFLGSSEGYPFHSGAVPDEIRRDLVPSCPRFVVQYMTLVASGYLISLSVCEQHNLGFFLLSRYVAEQISHLPWYLCAVVCGSLFTSIPFLISCGFLSRFQQRYLLFRLWWLVFSVPIVATAAILFTHDRLSEPSASHGGMAALPWQMNSPAWTALWLGAAVLTPYLLEGILFALFLKRKGGRRKAI